jgi:aminopeptidase
MDPRIREHAKIISMHSTSIGKGDNVVIDANPIADDLVTALCEICAEIGSNPLVIRERTGTRFLRAYLNSSKGEFQIPTHELALFKEMDVYIAIRGGGNASEMSDVDQNKMNGYNLVKKPIRDERLSKRWCLTQFPAPENAQRASMSTEEYENFVWDAIIRDWDVQKNHQQKLLELLENGDEVHIVSGDTTDITMNIGGMIPINDYGNHNLPGGEVFTAPIIESVRGEVVFDIPLNYKGKEIENTYLKFEGGVVTDYDAGKNGEVVGEILSADQGAKSVGELGIGMNRGIDRFTNNILFDEKMGDTIHIAIGMAYADTVGEGKQKNESSVHVDMITDMSKDSYIELDGELIQVDGCFVFEAGFKQK